MPGNATQHFRWFLEGDVAVVEVLSVELNQPHFAQEIGAQLRDLIDSRPAGVIVINFARTKYMSSTAFGALFGLIKVAAAAGVRLALCGMEPSVRFGADVLRLGEYMPIYDDEASALAAARKG